MHELFFSTFCTESCVAGSQRQAAAKLHLAGNVPPACGAGDNTVLLQQVAAMLLKRYKDSFAGGGVAATWTYLRQWALGALPPNPLTSHDTGPRHLRDPAFLKRALR